MTATIIQPLIRVFRFGATELPDIDPTMQPEEVLRHYSGAYPFLALATLGEPEVDGDRMVYPVRKREVQTKGAGLARLTRAQTDALDALSALDNQPSESPRTNAARWAGVFALTCNILSRPATPVADAMMIPML